MRYYIGTEFRLCQKNLGLTFYTVLDNLQTLFNENLKICANFLLQNLK